MSSQSPHDREARWQAEALADAARFAKTRHAQQAPIPVAAEIEGDSDAITEGDRCGECTWELQAGTSFCANCGFHFYEYDEQDRTAGDIDPVDDATIKAEIHGDGRCANCSWGVQQDATFCGGCGLRVALDDTAQPLISPLEETSDGSIFNWLRRGKRRDS